MVLALPLAACGESVAATQDAPKFPDAEMLILKKPDDMTHGAVGLAPDGRTPVCWAFTADAQCYLTVGEWRSAKYAQITWPQFAPDGRTFVFTASGDRASRSWKVVARDRESDAYEQISSLHVYPDGARVGFVALKDKEYRWKIMKLK
jgi:hypothetical protein